MVLRRLRIEEGWFTFFLTWGLVIIAALAILNAELIGGLEVIPFISTLAILTGLMLAKSRFSSRKAHLLALIYGLFLVTYLIGRSLPEGLTWQERIFDLFDRQFIWLGKAISQGSSRDGLIFVIHTSAVFWLLGYTAAWYTFRYPKLWRVVLPSGLVLLSVIYYYYGPKPLVGFLALYTLVALVYIARTHLVDKERGWRSASVRYEKNIRLSFLQASILAALLALGVAWGLPSAQASSAVSDALGKTGFSDTWRGFQDNWTRLFASLRSYGTTTSDPFRDSIPLGGPRTVSNSLVMDVYVEDRLPFVYWQAVAYDTYQNGGWSITSDTDTILRLPDDDQLELPDYAMRNYVNQFFVNFVPNSGTIYGAPEPFSSDRQIFVNRSLDDDGKALIHSVQSRYVMRQGEKYEVTSNYSIADATTLRQASSNYPNWVTEKYLQVPEEITPETKALALNLTEGLDNSFDKAIAVRNYLRLNIAYNDQIQAPPDGVDPVHYILFDQQEAYCNYYASAMIMMLRSVGVPARFVAGYTQGEWDEETSSYRVRASNAHAWTEVFFPGYGWVPFEATASIPAGDRPETFGNPGDAFGNEGLLDDTERLPEGVDINPNLEDVESLQDLLAERGELNPDVTVQNRNRLLWQAGIGFVIMIVAIVGAFFANRANQRVEASVKRSYGRLGNWAPWLGVLIQPAHTPYERAHMLGSEVPEGREQLLNLTHQYVRQLFSPARSVEADFDPRVEWKSLRPHMIRHTIGYQLQRLRNFRPGKADGNSK
jgi:transglutaminase-like putative cysteine protease